jgi:DNA polymerase III alpha subunit
VDKDTKVHLRKTELKGRSLWYDGQSSFDPEQLLRLIQQHDVHFVEYLTPLVKEYNQQVSKQEEIRVKTSCNPLNFDWVLPPEYKNLDVIEYVAKKHSAIIEEYSDNEILAREKRLAQELHKYKQRELFDVLRTIIFVINTLTENNIVWGVGRGSSVSSYVLYVIGAHDVDSFAYGLDINDFLHG